MLTYPEVSATLGKPRKKKKGKGWELQITYTKPDGSRTRRSFGARTKSEVCLKRDEFIKSIQKQMITKTSFCTIPDLLREEAEYLYYAAHRIKSNTYLRRNETIKTIERSNLGNKPIVDITEDDIIEFLGSLVNYYSDSIIKKIFGAIRAAYKRAIYHQILISNLMDSPYIIRPQSTKLTKEVTAFTPEEQKVFEEAIKNRSHKTNSNNYDLIMLIALHTGLRCGEICALTPDCVDFKNNIICVRNTVTRDENDKPIMGFSPKTEKGIREVPLNKVSKKLLKKAIEEFKPNPYNVLFYDFRNDKLITTNQVNESFKRLCKKNGIKRHGGQHLLRHTFATRNIEAGIAPEVLQNWLGHKDVTVTLNTYNDVFKRRDFKAVKKYDNYLESDFNEDSMN